MRRSFISYNIYCKVLFYKNKRWKVKYGQTMIDYLLAHQDKIVGIEINSHPQNGFLKFSLEDSNVKIFDKWDEEDQGLFAATCAGKKWDSSQLGIPSTFKLNTVTTQLTLSTDKPVQININGKSLNEWGEKVVGSNSFYKKRPENQSEQQAPEEKTFGGMKPGFLGSKK